MFLSFSQLQFGIKRSARKFNSDLEDFHPYRNVFIKMFAIAKKCGGGPSIVSH